jgi:polar amino acid transport system substrate-binding protein
MNTSKLSLRSSAVALSLLSALGTLGALSYAPATHADTLDDIEKRGVLRVAVPQDFAPFGSVGPSMQVEGLDIDVAALLAKKMGAKLELVPVTSANRIPYLQTKKVDLVISTLGKDAERDKVIDFSQPYSPYNNSVFGPASLKVDGPADLAGKTVGVARGTFQDLLLTKSVPPTAVVKRYDDNNGMITAYVSGQVPFIGTGDFVATKLASMMPADAPNKPVLKYVIHESSCRVGLNKSEPKLMTRVNGILTDAKKDGELNAIVQKWLHVPLPQQMAQTFD